MNTKSATSRMEWGFSSRTTGGLMGAVPSMEPGTMRGPSAPRWSQTADDPGPPLKANMTGRLLTSESVFAM